MYVIFILIPNKNRALYGVESWTLQKVDEKYPESFEVYCWIRMVEISWTMCVTLG
jgi:hypothetical protein